MSSCPRTLGTQLMRCFQDTSRRKGTRVPATKQPRLTILSFCRSSSLHFRSCRSGLGCYLRSFVADLRQSLAGQPDFVLQTSEDASLVQQRRRWITQKVMEIHIQEVSAKTTDCAVAVSRRCLENRPLHAVLTFCAQHVRLLHFTPSPFLLDLHTAALARKAWVDIFFPFFWGGSEV